MGGSQSADCKESIQNTVKSGQLSLEAWLQLLETPVSSAEIAKALDESFVDSLAEPEPLFTLLTRSLEVLGSPLAHSPQQVIGSLHTVARLLNLILGNSMLAKALWAQAYPPQIVTTLMSLLFEETTGAWSAAIRALSNLNFSDESLSIRAAAVKCIFQSLAGVLYVSFEESKEYTDPWAWLYAANPHAPKLFTSLLNTVCYGLDTEGSFIGDANKFAALCCQTIVTLLNFKERTNSSPQARHAKQWILTNIGEEAALISFKALSLQLNSEKSCLLIAEHMARLLAPWRQPTGYFLSSQGIRHYQQLLVLLWQLLDNSPVLRKHLANCSWTQDIQESLLGVARSLLTESRSLDAAQAVYFVLLQLSSDWSVCIVYGQRPRTALFHDYCSLFDVLLDTSYKILTLQIEHVALCHLVLTVIVNISPYVSQLGRLGAQRLRELLEFVNSPGLLLQGRHQFIPLVTEILESRLQYQYPGSLELVYALLSSREDWEKTGTTQNLSAASSLVATLFEDLGPRLDRFLEVQPNASEASVFEFLACSTMVGKFPRPPELACRTYDSNTNTEAWLNAFAWGATAMNFATLLGIRMDNIHLFPTSNRTH